MLAYIAKLPTQRGAWALLSASCFALLAAALFFQYQMDLKPCVKCIEQRSAVLAIALITLIPVFAPRVMLARIVAYIGWLAAAIWGWRIATDHLEIQNSENSWLFVCDMYPGFPSWMPLHEWFPSFFAAPGQCGEIDWQFIGISMPGWMQIIFAAYIISAVAVITARLIKHRSL